MPGGALHMFLADEKQQIVGIDVVVRLGLEEEVTHEQVRPVGGALQHDEAAVWEAKNQHTSFCTNR